MLLSTIVLTVTAIATLVQGSPVPAAPVEERGLEARAESLYTIRWQGTIFGLVKNFKEPIYTPVPIYNGQRPGLGPDAPKFMYGAWYMNPSSPYAFPMRIEGMLGEWKCLDAGSSPGNGNPVHMWDCYDGLTQQRWVTFNGKIKLADFNLCLDVVDGDSSKGLQVWECFDGNPNQQFDIKSI